MPVHTEHSERAVSDAAPPDLKLSTLSSTGVSGLDSRTDSGEPPCRLSVPGSATEYVTELGAVPGVLVFGGRVCGCEEREGGSGRREGGCVQRWMLAAAGEGAIGCSPKQRQLCRQPLQQPYPCNTPVAWLRGVKGPPCSSKSASSACCCSSCRSRACLARILSRDAALTTLRATVRCILLLAVCYCCWLWICGTANSTRCLPDNAADNPIADVDLPGALAAWNCSVGSQKLQCCVVAGACCGCCIMLATAVVARRLRVELSCCAVVQQKSEEAQQL